MSRFVLPAAIAVLVVVAGCASLESQILARASRDFTCPRKQILISDVVGELYRVKGCGFAATYDCQEDASLHFSCTVVEGTWSDSNAAASAE